MIKVLVLLRRNASFENGIGRHDHPQLFLENYNSTTTKTAADLKTERDHTTNRWCLLVAGLFDLVSIQSCGNLWTTHLTTHWSQKHVRYHDSHISHKRARGWESTVFDGLTHLWCEGEPITPSVLDWLSEKLGALVSSTPEGVHLIPSAKWESRWTAPRLVKGHGTDLKDWAW